MTEDARFEDAGDGPLYLQALDAEDLRVIAALVQDAVFPATEMKWDRGRRRFAMLINRFRWEARVSDRQDRLPPERVQSLLVFSDVLSVASQGIDRNDANLILSLLDVAFEPGDDGTGRVELTLAGDGAIAVSVEALDVTLKDVTRPYLAPSHHTPSHD